jgi:hypothetical protein
VTTGLGLAGLDIPRRNGELAFDAPWQSTVFALAGAVVEHALDGDREPFRQQLIKAIAEEPDRPYWENWTVALEALVDTLPEHPDHDRDRREDS